MNNFHLLVFQNSVNLWTEGGLEPAKSYINGITAQLKAENSDIELFATVLRMFFDAWNVMLFIAEDQFRVLKFARL